MTFSTGDLANDFYNQKNYFHRYVSLESSIFGQNTVVATAFYGLIFKIYFSRYKAIGNCVKELQNNFVKPKLYESGFFGRALT